MGQEREIKLRAASGEQLHQAYAKVVRDAQAEPERVIVMHTRYFDTPEGVLQAQKWMLRIREENGAQVLTFKTPGQGHCRGEWSLERTAADAVPTAQELAALVSQGAPAALTALSGLRVRCQARFTRTCRVLCLPDGTRLELAADEGVLSGAAQSEPLCELELELCSGDFEALARLAASTGLPEELRSKAQRAMRLP